MAVVTMKWYILVYVLEVINAQTNFIRFGKDLTRNSENCFKVPELCPNSNIVFYLYTRNTQNNPEILDPSDMKSIINAQFGSGVPLKVLIHGYTGHKDYAPNPELRQAYFQHGEYNIITIDWGLLGRPPCYIEAAYNVQIVGRCAAELLELIYTNHAYVTLENTHVIGFSLGAHLAGALATNLKSGKLPRLTGLDAALPLFTKLFTKASEMLDQSDATFVDAYHTNAGRRGRISTFGTVDFYLNNGYNQPGCNCNSSCSHYRAVEYFAESINSKLGLYGFECYNWNSLNKGSCNVTNLRELALMGEHISFEMTGVYYSFTNEKAPYAIQLERYKDVGKEAKRVDITC